MQGAGNGSCSESQDVDQLAQLLQLLLVLDAESLLLVDDHEPQLLEGDVLREEAVGADENVDLPFPGAGEDVLRLLRTLEAAHHLHRDRVIGEALGKGPMVLRREDRRRHQHGDLLLVFHRLECRPQLIHGLHEGGTSLGTQRNGLFGRLLVGGVLRHRSGYSMEGNAGTREDE